MQQQIQLQQLQQQQRIQQRQQEREARRPKWNKPSEMMSAEEIEMIIRIQEQQLSSDTNPFLEDYYYQNYMLLHNRKYSYLFVFSVLSNF